jgi:hypothetical protein
VLPCGRGMLLVVDVPGWSAVVRGKPEVMRCGGAVGGYGGRGQRGGGVGAARGPAGGLLAVEVAVAAAGRAAERVDGTLLSRCHELAAAVHRMTADTDRVVPEALMVPRRAATTSSAAAFSNSRCPGDALASARIRRLQGPVTSFPENHPRLYHRRVVACAHGHRRHLLIAVVIVLVEVHSCR